MIDSWVVARAENEDLDDVDYDEEHVELESDIGEYGTAEDDDEDLVEPDTVERQSFPPKKSTRTEVKEPSQEETSPIGADKGDADDLSRPLNAGSVISGATVPAEDADEISTRNPMEKAKYTAKTAAKKAASKTVAKAPAKKAPAKKAS